jgi:hypothetical protein
LTDKFDGAGVKDLLLPSEYFELTEFDGVLTEEKEHLIIRLLIL